MKDKEEIHGESRALMTLSWLKSKRVRTAIEKICYGRYSDGKRLLLSVIDSSDIAPEAESIIDQQMGIACYALGEYKEAGEYLKKSLRLFKQIGLHESDYEVLCSTLYLSLVYAKTGDFERAEQGLEYCGQCVLALHATWEDQNELAKHVLLALQIYANTVRTVGENEGKFFIDDKFIDHLVQSGVLLASRLVDLARSSTFVDESRLTMVSFLQVMLMNDSVEHKLKNIKSLDSSVDGDISADLNTIKSILSACKNFHTLPKSDEPSYYAYNRACLNILRGNDKTAYEELMDTYNNVRSPDLRQKIQKKLTELWDKYSQE